MSEFVLADKEDLTAIADAVRTSTGSTDTYSVSELSAAAVSTIEAGGGSADWNAAEGEPGHVLNRTHWTKPGMVEILPEITIAIEDEGETPIITPYTMFPTTGNTYTITYNGVDYECVCEYFDDGQGVAAALFGNGSLLGLPFETTDPFIVLLITPESLEAMGGVYGMIVPLDGSTSVTVSIKGEGEEVKKLDKKYYETPNWNAASEKDEGFIKNRPCGYFITDRINASGELISGTALGLNVDVNACELPIIKPIVPGEICEVTYDGEVYKCVVNNGGNIGNHDYVFNGGENNAEPFLITNTNNAVTNTCAFYDLTGKAVGETVSVMVQGKDLKGLPTGYMSEIVEDAEDIAKYMDAYAGLSLDTEKKSIISYNPLLLEAVESIKKRGVRLRLPCVFGGF